jgi:hypothetical protein
MTPVERIRRQLERRVKDTAPELGAEILRAWDRLAATMEGEAFRRLVAQSITLGSPDPILAQLLTDDVLDRIFSEVARQQFGNINDALNFWGRQHVTATGSTIGITFGTLSPEVLEAIRNESFKALDTLKADLRGALRETVTRGLQEGINPRAMARELRRNVSADPGLIAARDRFRQELETNSRAALRRALGRSQVTRPDGTLAIRRGHAGGFGLSKKDMDLLQQTLGVKGKSLTPAQIDKLVEAYEKRMVAWRAEALSRTAALQAQKTGQHLATEQAIADGILDKDRMLSAWRTIGDSFVRPEHAAREGETVRFGERFSSGDVIPGDSEWGCRCIKQDYQATEAEWAKYEEHKAEGIVGPIRQPATTG